LCGFALDFGELELDASVVVSEGLQPVNVTRAATTKRDSVSRFIGVQR
jgi:hypothetical protein